MNKDLLAKAKDIVATKNDFLDWASINKLHKAEIKANLVDDVAIEYEKLLRIGKTDKQRRDYFAGVSLQALITKLPLMDQKGEMGVQLTEEESQQIKRDISESAWIYADWMLYTQGINQ